MRGVFFEKFSGHMFIALVVGLLIGAFGFYQLPSLGQLPWLSLVWGLLLALLWGWTIQQARPTPAGVRQRLGVSGFLLAGALGVALGGVWPFLFHSVQSPINPSLYFQPIEVTGQVVGLAEKKPLSGARQGHRVVFELALQQVHAPKAQAWDWAPPKVRVSWYGASQLPRPGETWRLWVKLKPAWSSRNPGAFDYEQWLFQKGIVAKGYVRDRAAPIRVAKADWAGRMAVIERLKPVLAPYDFSGVYQGLIYGDRSGLSDQDWTLLRETGTVHLMAISGLHIGLVAAMGYMGFAWLWQMAVRLRPQARWAFMAKPVFAALGALAVAGLYAGLAGWAVSTQRAWWMLAAGLLFLLWRRPWQPASVLALAAFVVMINAPTSVLSQGFWLSFGAVGLIFATLRHPWVQAQAPWRQAVLIQAVLTVGLWPLLMVFYQQMAWASFFANLVAVPFVSLIGLPLLALASGLGMISSTLSAPFLWLSDWLWQGLWAFLQGVQAWMPVWSTPQWALWQAGWFYAGVWFWVWLWQRPGRVAKRWVGLGVLVWGVFLWPGAPQPLAPGHWRMTVMDVGQAQALVFETQEAVVVYDTGAQWGSLDGTRLAIAPYLHQRNRDRVALLIVSHADQDHMGGTASLFETVAIDQAVSGQPQRLKTLWPGAKAQTWHQCLQGQAWVFSGVRFEVLAPASAKPKTNQHNDQSCVLKVSGPAHQVLVTGDLSQSGERALLASDQPVSADILVAGHHGSNTSTSSAFLQAVSPQRVVFSSGFANRYGFPRPAVLERVAAQSSANGQGVPWHNTACEGALQWHFSPERWHLQRSRAHTRRWYHHQCHQFAPTQRMIQPDFQIGATQPQRLQGE
mgnify:CR=1 FL=1